MPDPVALLGAMAAAALVAAAIVLGCAWPWRAPRPARAAAGWVLGVGGGFYLGCRLLGLWPRWPPPEDLDRLLALVMPLALAVEVLAVFPVVPRLLMGALRFIVVAGAARVLLHGSTYLSDSGRHGWSLSQTWLVLAGLGAALAANWALLLLLARRGASRSVPLVLATANVGAAVTVMFSGYLTGGPVGLPLAAALTGAAVASLAIAGPPASGGAVALGVLGLFSLLIIGHFFGSLTPTHAVLLFAAPLAGWVPEMVPPGRRRPWLLGPARLALVIIPVALVAVDAQRKFAADSHFKPQATEPSMDDYRGFGK
jgi:hypothetical protein